MTIPFKYLCGLRNSIIQEKKGSSFFTQKLKTLDI